ncbi:MAG: hypothetical protein Q4D95_04720 [Peptoniphilus sp.]|nr:hypothetical protein [Peptoniphilus sp.]
MNKKLLISALSLGALVTMYVPGTFAIEAGHDKTLVCEKKEHIHRDDCYTISEVSICDMEEGEEHVHAESCYGEERVLNCTLEEHLHDQDCYEDSVVDSPPVEEHEDPVVDNPPIEGGNEDPTVDNPPVEEPNEDFTEVQQESDLFERLMACETQEELKAVMKTASAEEFLALTDEEHARILAKFPIKNPPKFIMQEELKEPQEPVKGGIIYPAVNFDRVAPLVDSDKS